MGSQGGTVPKIRRTAFAVIVGLGLVTAAVAPAAAAVSQAKGSTEIGVTAKTVTIAVVADVDNPIAPNVFKGVVDGAQAAAKYVNANGGVAGRTLKVDFIDSHLNPNETRNAIITACSQDLAMVGTATALFSGLDDLTGCKDQAGAATGLPDIGAIVLGTPQACAPVSFPVIPSMVDCSTVGQNPQTYRGNQGVFKYLSKQHHGDLHGPFIKTNDSADAARSTDVLAEAAKHAGIDVTGMPVLSNRDPQSAFTPIVTQMKQDGANWSDNGLAAPGAVLFRQEAALQGLDTDSIVWQCTSACYDVKAMATAGDAMNGENVDLGFLPFSEAKSNATLAAFLKYVGKDNANAFGVYGFEAVLAFRDAANTAAKSSSGLTRSSVLTALKGMTSFNADGMVGTVNIGGKVPSSCFMLVQWNTAKFTRVYPKKAGTFDCTPSNRYTFQADLTTP
jgi:ABC-type branched-subunit amino acid transport system substrate-binding protein